MNRGEIKTECLVRLGADTTAAYFTEPILNNWINQAYSWSANMYKWPFTEYMDKSGAFTLGTETYSYPNVNLKTDTVRLLKIGSYLFEKKDFSSYSQYREDYPNATDKIFSDFGRTLYINPNCASGTIYAYGQLVPGLMLSDSGSAASSTVFSTFDPEGDEAIVNKVMSYAKEREGDVNKVNLYDTKARGILAEMWKRIQGEQAMYQTKDRELFKRIDVVDGSYYEDLNKPNQF